MKDDVKLIAVGQIIKYRTQKVLSKIYLIEFEDGFMGYCEKKVEGILQVETSVRADWAVSDACNLRPPTDEEAKQADNLFDTALSIIRNSEVGSTMKSMFGETFGNGDKKGRGLCRLYENGVDRGDVKLIAVGQMINYITHDVLSKIYLIEFEDGFMGYCEKKVEGILQVDTSVRDDLAVSDACNLRPPTDEEAKQADNLFNTALNVIRHSKVNSPMVGIFCGTVGNGDKKGRGLCRLYENGVDRGDVKLIAVGQMINYITHDVLSVYLLEFDAGFIGYCDRKVEGVLQVMTSSCDNWAVRDACNFRPPTDEEAKQADNLFNTALNVIRNSEVNSPMVGIFCSTVGNGRDYTKDRYRPDIFHYPPERYRYYPPDLSTTRL